LEFVQLKRDIMAPPRPGRWDMEGRPERNWRKVGGARGEDWDRWCWATEELRRDCVLRVEALLRVVWMGSRGEEGVALVLRRWVF
jgi:hypothetical protein